MKLSEPDYRSYTLDGYPFENFAAISSTLRAPPDRRASDGWCGKAAAYPG